MRKIYSAYKRPLGIGARPAILAIDLYSLVFQGGVFQGGVVEPAEVQNEFPSTCGRYAHEALEPITQVLRKSV